MCGIVGILDLAGRAVDRGPVVHMAACLEHRGPDFHAVMARDAIALGHTRLSIIDVSDAANQPMVTADGRYAVVFNGEIYNFRELKSELQRAGCVFTTASDTEVLLTAYAHWGDEAFGRLNGMFAAALFDFAKQELTLVRDRFGIKPLNYAMVGGRLYFASEVKAILRGLEQTPAVDSSKLLEFLMYRELITGTFFQDIRTLEPGAFLRVSLHSGDIEERQWFVPEQLVDEMLMSQFRRQSRSARLDAVDHTLRQAVQRHLISDVPVGTLCSGGTDSSLLTALCTEMNPNVSVYHVDVAGISERTWADAVARHLGIDMHYVELNEDTFLANYVDTIYFNDFPLTHPNGIGVFLVSELARANGCKVLLTGEGADETFGGYDWRYRNRLRYRSLQRLFKWPIKAVSGAVYHTTDVWLKRFDVNFNFKSRAPVGEVVSLLSDHHYRREHWQRCYDRLPSTMSRTEREIQASLVSDLRDYISGILHRQDRASMQASIESRVPFLDHTVAGVAVNLPLGDKVTWFDYKPLLKQLAARYLPREVVYREKVGFGTPGDTYAARIDRSIFDDGFIEQTLGIEPRHIRQSIEADFPTFGHQLLGLEFWGRMFVRGESRFALRERFVPTTGLTSRSNVARMAG